MGGTGNILFELASGVAIAAHYRLNVCLDSSSHWYPLVSEVATLVNDVPEQCPGRTQARIDTGDRVDITNHCCVFEDFTVTPNSPNVRLKAFNRFFRQSTLSLEDLFNRQRGQHGDLYYLHSYLQSWKYFRLGPGKEEMRLKEDVILSAKRRLESLAPNHTRVAVHLRITDASGPQHIYNYPGPLYFQKAFQHFRRKYSNVKFLVFSDNPNWCRRQSLLTSEDVHIVEGAAEEIDKRFIGRWESAPKNVMAASNGDLVLMSVCEGVILSVGTFGWWAGHFSHQGGSEVVYFKDSFNRVMANEDTAKEEDHFPPGWIGITAPPLDRHGMWVQDLSGDILPRAPHWR